MTYKSNYKIGRTRFYSCARKVLFLDEESAKRRADEINRKEGGGGNP